MPRTRKGRLVHAVTEPLWQRDKLEMNVADALLSAVERKRRRPSVLCPIDFSDHSRRALRFAVALALREKAALRVLYVNDPLLVAAAAAALHDREFGNRSRGELKTFVEATIPAAVRRRVPLTLQVLTGRPSDQILKAARRQRPDVVVIGTHGLTGAARVLMGSTTKGVLQRATVPVLVVPRRARVPALTRMTS